MKDTTNLLSQNHNNNDHNDENSDFGQLQLCKAEFELAEDIRSIIQEALQDSSLIDSSTVEIHNLKVK